MAVGTKDLLNLSVLQLLLCPARMLLRGWLLLSKTEYNFLLIRCSTAALRGSSLLPTTELAFLTSLSRRLQFLSVVQLPQQTTAQNSALIDSVIKHAHHITTDIEGPEPPQEEDQQNHTHRLKY